MPPKKKTQSNGTHPENPTKAEPNPRTKHDPNDIKPSKTTTNSKKRKAEPPSTSTPSKTPRRSTRSLPSPQIKPSQFNLLNYLISPSSLSTCRPKDETEDLKKHFEGLRTYSSSTFTPFEELLAATILSRPIGHMLGVRSIRTLFNPPYSLTTPRAILAAGTEGCRAALDAARTQHRQKTAAELVMLAEAVAAGGLGSGEDDVGLERVREESGRDVGMEREMLRKRVKGLGGTGLEIFGRRIQGGWGEWFPFVDRRTGRALEELGLPGEAEALRGLVEERWGELEMGDLEEGEEDDRKRRVFVRVLERAVGAELEGRLDDVKAEAA